MNRAIRRWLDPHGCGFPGRRGGRATREVAEPHENLVPLSREINEKASLRSEECSDENPLPKAYDLTHIAQPEEPRRRQRDQPQREGLWRQRRVAP
jgi:hypothetical protein